MGGLRAVVLGAEVREGPRVARAVGRDPQPQAGAAARQHQGAVGQRAQLRVDGPGGGGHGSRPRARAIGRECLIQRHVGLQPEHREQAPVAIRIRCLSTAVRLCSVRRIVDDRSRSTLQTSLTKCAAVGARAVPCPLAQRVSVCVVCPCRGRQTRWRRRADPSLSCATELSVTPSAFGGMPACASQSIWPRYSHERPSSEDAAKKHELQPAQQRLLFCTVKRVVFILHGYSRVRGRIGQERSKRVLTLVLSQQNNMAPDLYGHATTAAFSGCACCGSTPSRGSSPGHGGAPLPS